MNFLDYLSDNDVSIDVNHSEGLQRTEDWHEARRGRFTGSKIKILMGCTRATAKMEWGRPEKLIDFSQTALRYVYTRARERQTGKVIKSKGSKTMDYGTDGEDVVKQLVLEKWPAFKPEEVGFIEFLPGIAGASPDWLLKGRKKVGAEIKCATTFEAEFDRLYEVFDQSHQDFWQIQSEMLALKVDELMYIVAEPTENMESHEISSFRHKMVKASPIHQKAIVDRCKIGDAIIKKFLSGIEWHVAVEDILSNF